MYGETLAMNVVDNWLTAYRTALGGYCIRLWRTPEILGDRRPLAAEGLPEQFPLISRVFVLMTHPDASAESGLSFAQSMGGQKLLPGFLGGISGVVLWVLIQTNKNEVISRITRSTPNQFQLNWAFVQALLHLLGPIAIVVAAQLSGRLRSIVAPLLDVIR